MKNSGKVTGRYIIISPVKDEERHLETTIRAVARQTVQPLKWVIVDDGSRDRTPEILKACVGQFDWVEVVRIERECGRLPGTGVIFAFNLGLQRVAADKFDYIVKLDCDLDLPEDYFERLMARFEEDPTLGIASGVYKEKQRERWIQVPMPEYHAAGASKMIRARCFSEILGFVPERGWDTVDEIRAQVRGWQTRHFDDLKFYHLRVEGSAVGMMRTNILHGEVFFLTGGSQLFLILKVMDRILFGKPFLIGGVMLLFGYLRAWVLRKPKLVNDQEAAFYKRRLIARVADRITQLFGGVKLKRNILRCD